MKVGDRVKTAHGPGTVQGWECFDSEGMCLPTLSDTANRWRMAVKLDPGHTWAFKDGLYCCWPGEVEHEN